MLLESIFVARLKINDADFDIMVDTARFGGWTVHCPVESIQPQAAARCFWCHVFIPKYFVSDASSQTIVFTLQ